MKFIGKREEIIDSATQYLDRYSGKPLQEFVMQLKMKRAIRSLRANRFYWAVMNLLELESEVGYDKDEWHDFFKCKYLTYIATGPDGGDYRKTLSTSDLDSGGFSAYMNKIKDFVIRERFLLAFPEPEDRNFMKWCEERGL